MPKMILVHRNVAGIELAAMVPQVYQADIKPSYPVPATCFTSHVVHVYNRKTHETKLAFAVCDESKNILIGF